MIEHLGELRSHNLTNACIVWTTAEQVLRLQAQLAQWLAEQESVSSSQGGAYTPPHSNTFGPKNAWSLPAWTGSEEDAAA